MKFDWQNWNIGGKIIFVAASLSTLSMFLNWVDVGIMSQTGLSQWAFLFLILYIYPVVSLLNNSPINRFGGILSATLAIVSVIIYISSKSIEVFGSSINMAATGAYLFLFASIALVVGVIKYSPPLVFKSKIERKTEANTPQHS